MQNCALNRLQEECKYNCSYSNMAHLRGKTIDTCDMLKRLVYHLKSTKKWFREKHSKLSALQSQLSLLSHDLLHVKE